MRTDLPITLPLPESFFKEETLSGFIVSTHAKQIWAVELDLLFQFDKVCKKYNIQYMASGGTMLGAVRHKGFIPWDDDIDVMMKREEYDKLCQIAPKEFTRPYFFQTEYSDPGSMRGHAQLRNSNTTAILKSEVDYHFTFNQGIFIDIFILDNIPDGFIERSIFFSRISRKYALLKKISNISYRYNENTRQKSKFFKRLIKDILTKSAKRLNVEQACYRNYEKYVSKYNTKTTKKIGLISVPFLGERCRYFTSDLGCTKDATFENLLIPIPVNYTSILNKQYGNWREPIIGGSIHGDVLFDPFTPYTEYLKNSDEEKRATLLLSFNRQQRS